MNYEGRIFRPPSEAYSLIVQVTIGCSHNKCTFCDMYKEKKFRVRKLDDIKNDFLSAKKIYGSVQRIFLADGDALMARTELLVDVLKYIKEIFPDVERISTYASPKSVLIKSDEDLKLLNSLGLKMAYLGLESGSDKVLNMINKGETKEEIVRASKKLKDAGFILSVTAISGMGGKELMEEHAIQTGKALSEINPHYIGLLTLMLEGDIKIIDDINSGKFKLLSAEEVAFETLLMLENLDSDKSVFRSNHASNYLSLKGTLNKDKQDMINILKKALSGDINFKSEFLRGL